ncbi:hypothetical protein ColLi_00329 [Colletotrichum liriopes]|uniref:Uncharacterized protein n=1 Tax=Colletotrichum liriopes TaxID=708192 RepID=A0AA37GAU5_9PEZI|nr:hypothetical protein ColLi_00329 [Colletotrichum liriopes]
MFGHLPILIEGRTPGVSDGETNIGMSNKATKKAAFPKDIDQSVSCTEFARSIASLRRPCRGAVKAQSSEDASAESNCHSANGEWEHAMASCGFGVSLAVVS